MLTTTGNIARRLRRMITFALLAPICWSSQIILAAGGDLGTWPEAYSVLKGQDRLTLKTRFYRVEHDLGKGGAISRIVLQHGKATNLLVEPVQARFMDENGAVYTDLNCRSPKVMHKTDGLHEVVTVETALTDAKGQEGEMRLKTTYEYRWGYIKVRREFTTVKPGVHVREICPLATVLDSGLWQYGYREGTTEEEGAPAFSFGSNKWGKLRAAQGPASNLRTRYVPRSLLFANPGVEGLEWFEGSNLQQWDLQLTGKRGQGLSTVEMKESGVTLSLSPYSSTNTSVPVRTNCSYDFYLGLPILPGHALGPWLHTSFNRNGGQWVSASQITKWAESGIQTVHCHNDGDYYNDGLFWRDGSYPPYPDMDKYDQVLRNCRAANIRTATYFSNKELHPSTREYQEHGLEWGRMNRKGALQHNFFRGTNEFGAQMCLRSGWLEFLKFSIDRVLKNHPLNGVYYDWNVALLCCNPLHEGKHKDEIADGHWDIDELIDLMEWTRQRVGPEGLVIVHNTTTPMFAAENFANDVVATEWGYGKWKDSAPPLADLPLEWSLVGARSRGVISYGTIDAQAPQRLHKVFALGAFVAGVTPWPASAETFELLPVLKPVGDFSTCKFQDWRNRAVTLSSPGCAAAVYGRPGEAFVLLANMEKDAREITCTVKPDQLPFPLQKISVARVVSMVAGDTAKGKLEQLNASELTANGTRLTLPGDSAILVKVSERE